MRKLGLSEAKAYSDAFHQHYEPLGDVFLFLILRNRIVDLLQRL